MDPANVTHQDLSDPGSMTPPAMCERSSSKHEAVDQQNCKLTKTGVDVYSHVTDYAHDTEEEKKTSVIESSIYDTPYYTADRFSELGEGEVFDYTYATVPPLTDEYKAQDDHQQE